MKSVKTLDKIFGGLFSLIILAPIVAIIASNFSIDDLWNYGWLILFILSLLLIVYLLLRLVFYKKILESDITSFQRIMQELNLITIERILHLYSSNIGFTDNTSIMIESFIMANKHVGNQFINKRLKSLLNNFVKALNNYYQRFSSNACFKNGIVRIYPEMKTNEPVKYNNLIKELDKLGNIAYNKLTTLLDFANRNNIQINSK